MPILRPCNRPRCPELVPKGYCDKHSKKRQRGYDRARGTARERGYDARWDRLSKRYRREHPLCEECEAVGMTRTADVVHHILPVADGGPMYDWDNLRSLCHAHHSAIHSSSRRAEYMPKGVPAIGERLTIVCGPPRAGKNTYVQEQATGDHILIDLDEIKPHGSDMSLTRAFAIRDDQLRAAAEGDRSVWFVIGAPLPQQRQHLDDMLQPGRIVVLETPPDVCIERAVDDPRDIERAIHRWWEQYERRDGDVVLQLQVA